MSCRESRNHPELEPRLHHLLTREMGWPAAQRQWVTGLLEAGLLAGR
jgi:hypothetical protein